MHASQREEPSLGFSAPHQTQRPAPDRRLRLSLQLSRDARRQVSQVRPFSGTRLLHREHRPGTRARGGLGIAAMRQVYHAPGRRLPQAEQ